MRDAYQVAISNKITYLHLRDPKSKSECDLFHTTAIATEKIYIPGGKPYEVLLRYFEYLDTEMPHLGAGAILDHKLEVALFLAQYPNAKWEAW